MVQARRNPHLSRFHAHLALCYTGPMHQRTLRLLEFDKILEQLARFTSFSVGQERVHALQPTDDIRLARDWQARRVRHAACSTRKRPSTWAPYMTCARCGGQALPVSRPSCRRLHQHSLHITARTASAQSRPQRHRDRFRTCDDVAMRMDAPQSIIDEIVRCIDERRPIECAWIAPATRWAHPPASCGEAHARVDETGCNASSPTPTNHAFPAGSHRHAAARAARDPLRAECKGRIPPW